MPKMYYVGHGVLKIGRSTFENAIPSDEVKKINDQTLKKLTDEKRLLTEKEYLKSLNVELEDKEVKK